MNDSWFVFSEGQQLGPYTGEQLVQFAQAGNINEESLIWAEGMADWLPAAQIPGLFPAAPAPAPAAPAPAPASAAWAPPGARTTANLQPGKVAATGKVSAVGLVSAAPPGGPYPYFPVKSASFGLWAGAFAASVVCMVLAIVSVFSAAKAAAQAGAPEAAQEMAASQGMMGGVLMLIAMVASILSAVFLYMNLYRAWLCLQPGGARTTPGKAIGMLFVPFFNLYWIFVAIAGLPKDWNRIMSSYEGLETAPRLKENFFLMFCIGALVFPPLSMVMIFPIVSQICKGVNFFAFRRDPNKPSAFASPGGFKFK